MVSWNGKIHYSRGCFFLFIIIIRFGRLVKIRWSGCISKFCISFSRKDSGLWKYHLVEWSNFNFLHKSFWISLPTQSCLVLYSFCACLLHSLIMWSIVSSPSPHNLHLLFCFVLLYLLFLCYASLGISTFYYLLTSTLRKRIFAQKIITINTISVYRSNSD